MISSRYIITTYNPLALLFVTRKSAPRQCQIHESLHPASGDSHLQNSCWLVTHSNGTQLFRARRKEQHGQLSLQGPRKHRLVQLCYLTEIWGMTLLS